MEHDKTQQICGFVQHLKLRVGNSGSLTRRAERPIRSEVQREGRKNSSSRVRHQHDVTATIIKDVAAIFFSV